MIVIWTEYKAEVEGSASKFVRCERCATQYVYTVHCATYGEASNLLVGSEKARQQARDAAYAALRRDLDAACEAVPCPKCFHVQSHMLFAAREEKYGGLRGFSAGAFGFGLFAALLLIPILLISSNAVFKTGSAIVTGVLLLVGLVFGGVDFWLRSKFDPNQQPEEARAAKAAARAKLLNQFISEQSAETSELYDEYRKSTKKRKGAFPIDLWILPEQLAREETLPVPLPTGERRNFALTKDYRDGDLFEIDSETDRESDFVVRLRLFSISGA